VCTTNGSTVASRFPVRRVLPLLFAGALAATVAVAGTTAGSAAPVRSTVGGGAGQEAKPLLPNLVPLRANDIYITGSGEDRQLRFETSLASIGRGPMEVRPNRQIPCRPGQRGASQIMYRDVDGSKFFKRSVDTTFKRRKAGCMVFHPTHNHWHFEASTFYALRPVTGEQDRTSAFRKTSFCMRDSERVPAQLGTYNQPLHYGACSQDRPMGINIGWADVYQSFLDGQSLHLGDTSKVPDGRYCLTIRVDPKESLVESNEDDNLSARSIRISGSSVTMLPNSVCD